MKMDFKKLVARVNENVKVVIPAEAFELVDELSRKGFSEKDMRSKLKKQFPKIANTDLDILVKVA